MSRPSWPGLHHRVHPFYVVAFWQRWLESDRTIFFPFARDLMKICVDSNSKQRIFKNRNNWIKDGLTKVCVHEALLSKFQKVVVTLHGYIREKLIYGIYKRMAEYTMQSYPKRTNSRTFDTEKYSAKDKSTTKSRTLIQNGSPPDGNKSNGKKKQRGKKDHSTKW